MEIILILYVLIMTGCGFIAAYNYSECCAACRYVFKTCQNYLDDKGEYSDDGGLIINKEVAKKKWLTYSQAFMYMDNAAKVSMSILIIEAVLFVVVSAIAVWLYS